MISSAVAMSQSSPLQAVPSGRPRLLIITDSSERLSKLRASLNVGEVEITSATSPEEMCSGCGGGGHDLVVVDVSPETIRGVLNRLRRCPGCTKIPVLVEADRLTDNTGLAGLLPRYRAMPCSRTDLVALSRRITKPEDQEPRGRGLL
jgi:PleD family two-component response regulator